MGTGVAAVGELSAHPVAVLAIPAFIPVVGIVLTILWIARQDRRAEAAEESDVREPPPVEEPAPHPRRPWRDRLPRLVIGDDDA
ncbi:hypothetical protein QE370_001528 [Aeromicrobium sp. SORGH_AS981]|uniref:hypothetical protein n=1 Tax=Aeromicrobium sp. SORGH_AS_0981 TaxID=3041802 RepID=UPI0028566941|nr:hypothetical protein [Aeromicrobium sp. SORGH_AS_0981]MDR6118344.1 hypothetical protein [Aeromicrobium sp. SORGH_AS_0981]